ncbi:WXG100 family type VII secretion target [Kitasatospora sp. NPDC058063]|uniref:WXG100 family type VII secretion target n=1 Tax=unclassified Kitasatospora TaxID=2633591 RepID=UPI0036DF15BF
MAGTTDFDGIDHAVLKGMVDGAKPAEVLKRAAQLQDAGRVLSELSKALQAHLGQVSWEGPAAENFKTWVGNLYKSAAIISQHSTTAGSAMTQAGEALSTARAAVPVLPQTEIDAVARHNSQTVYIPPAAAQNIVGQSVDSYMASVDRNWVTADAAKQAKAKIEKERQEAILQLEKLAQAYSAATTTLNGIDDNVSLPGTPGDGRDRDSKTTFPVGGGSGGGHGGSVRNPRSGSGSAGGGSTPSDGGYGGGTVQPRDPGSGGPGPGTPGSTLPPPHGGGQVPPAPQDPGTSIPPSYPSDPVNRPGTDLNSVPTLPTIPTQTGPYGPGGGQPPTDGPTTLPGYPNGTGGPNNGPGVPGGGGPITGFPAGAGGGTVPTKGGGSGYVPGKGGGQIQPRTTPFGGGPGQGRSGTPGLPSGTVFGAREAGPGGGRVGGPGGAGGMHPGMGGAHGGAVGSGGGSRGRGLSSTTGGTVGGRKGPSAGGEFTPGGTGLRNRAAGAAEGGAQSRQNGMMAPGSSGHGSRNERDRRKRADYLHEDEETWTSGTPHSNPDVIE